MVSYRIGRFLSVAALVLCFGVATADDVTIVADPPATPDQITVIQQPAPDTKVTVIKESDADRAIRHEAVIGVESAPETALIVRTAPPEPKPEVVQIETRPAEGFVWVPGYWRWDADRATYEWVSGTWRRSIPDLVWHPGHWQKAGEGYTWVSGYWAPKAEPEARMVVVKEAPPASREEAKPASPGPDYVWIAGHWEYKAGQYNWVPGRWERPTAEGMVYVPGQWVRSGDGYAYISGHWDYPEENRTVVVQREE